MLDIKKILFPTDFSRCSEQAFAHALLLAEQHQATLQLFHAVVLHADDSADPGAHFPGNQELLAKMFEVADSELASLTELHKGTPITIEEHRERGISAADLILEHAREHDVDLIVMGTHGRRGPAKFFLGSVASEVVRRAKVPVLSLREVKGGRPLEAIEKILVPIDFSDHSKTALRHATELARTYHAGLQLVHVVQQPVYPYFYAPVPALPPVEQIQNLRERGLSALNELVAELGDPDIRHEVRLLDGHPASEIVAFAEKEGSDLIVTASHGLTGLERLLVGSTSEQVVTSSLVPVLLVKSFGKQILPPEPAGTTSLTYREEPSSAPS